MKRFMMSILMLFILVTTYAADSGLVDDFAVPVTFTYRSGINLGFSRSQVGIQWFNSSLGEDGNEIKFSYNSGTGKIETGFFYFYAQIYTTNKVKITVGVPNGGSTSNPAILSGDNETLEYQSDPQLFTPSTNWWQTYYTGNVLHDEESKADDYLALPRVYLLRLNLSVDPDDLVGKTSAKFTGTLVFNVEVQS